MPNPTLFSTRPTKRATELTSEKTPAYHTSPEVGLATLACTGCFNNTFYAHAKNQLDLVLELADKCSDEFIAKTAIYAREKGYMKDMPALLLALLSTKNPVLFRRAFSRTINNLRMVRGFVQIMRSGQVNGRKSLGSGPKKMIQQAILNTPDFLLLNGTVGNKPSLADLIKMVRPKPRNDEQSAMFAWILGKPCNFEHLPEIFRQYELFKHKQTDDVPRVNFRLIDGLPNLNAQHWHQLASTMNWTTTRMNINTLARHGAFRDESVVRMVVDRLKSPELVKKSMCFPYQIMSAYKASNGNHEVPGLVRSALQDAMEIATDAVPKVDGKVMVACDVSGSMRMSVTGQGGWHPDRDNIVRCVDVAALFSACLLRKNPDTRILPFHSDVKPDFHPNPRDTVLTIAEQLASYAGGATHVSAPLKHAIRHNEKYDLIVYISDYEANIDNSPNHYYGSTDTEMQLAKYKDKVNKNVKCVLINIVPERHHQFDGDKLTVLQVAGFSDRVFEVVSSFLETNDSNHWAKVINGIEI